MSRRGVHDSAEDAHDDDRVRLDKWLWAARFFKTRALAAEAIGGGKIEVNGEKAKRAKPLHPGDRVRIQLGPYEHVVTVRALSGRRGPASEAQLLYEEEPASLAARARIAEAHRLANQAFAFGEGKPSKKERREIDRYKGK